MSDPSSLYTLANSTLSSAPKCNAAWGKSHDLLHGGSVLATFRWHYSFTLSLAAVPIGLITLNGSDVEPVLQHRPRDMQPQALTPGKLEDREPESPAEGCIESCDNSKAHKQISCEGSL